jgi:urea transport system substrate-binding protein
MAHGYLDVYAWAAAVTKAGSFDPDKVRKAAVTLAYSDVGLGETKFATNQSLVQTGYVAQLEPSGQFKILWQSKGPIVPVPYDPLSFPGKTCVL